LDFGPSAKIHSLFPPPCTVRVVGGGGNNKPRKPRTARSDVGTPQPQYMRIPHFSPLPTSAAMAAADVTEEEAWWLRFNNGVAVDDEEDEMSEEDGNKEAEAGIDAGAGDGTERRSNVGLVDRAIGGKRLIKPKREP
jgi:hypothetical protein